MFKRFAAWAAGVMFCFGLFLSVQIGRSGSQQNQIFRVEYTKPISSVQSLDIIFSIRIDAKKAEEILREIMIFTIKNFPPSTEILGTTWSSIGRDVGDEQMIRFPNDKAHIVYNPKTKTFSYL